MEYVLSTFSRRFTVMDSYGKEVNGAKGAAHLQE